MRRVLDGCCGAGGASVGYARAGHEVDGFDLRDQPSYPFTFRRANILDVLSDRKLLSRYTFVHVSPPCQRWAAPQFVNGYEDNHPDLVTPVRALLEENFRGPWVIENVINAPLRDPIELCGEVFGLGVIRHRRFESNFPLIAPRHKAHRGKVRGWRHGEYFDGPYVAVYGNGGGKADYAEASTAMGIDWMGTTAEIKEAIPPAYTQYIGGFFR